MEFFYANVWRFYVENLELEMCRSGIAGICNAHWFPLGLERIHQVTNTIRIAIQGGEYDTYREYTFSQRLN